MMMGRFPAAPRCQPLAPRGSGVRQATASRSRSPNHQRSGLAGRSDWTLQATRRMHTVSDSLQAPTVKHRVDSNTAARPDSDRKPSAIVDPVPCERRHRNLTEPRHDHRQNVNSWALRAPTEVPKRIHRSIGLARGRRPYLAGVNWTGRARAARGNVYAVPGPCNGPAR